MRTRRKNRVVRIKTIDQFCEIIGAHRISSGEPAFTVVDQTNRERVFLTDTELFDAPASEIAALWATLEPKEKRRLALQRSQQRKREGIAHRRKRAADDRANELEYRSRLDDFEPELDDADPIAADEPELIEEEIAAD